LKGFELMMTPIRKEGRLYIIATLVAATLLSGSSIIYPFLTLRIFALVSWVLFLLVINFFRDPERKTPVDAANIISPADGKIIDIRKVTEEDFLHREVTRVSIFMSVFDVHVNRAPVKGVVDYVYYNKGAYLPAYREKASLDNEQMTIGFTRSYKENGQEEFKVMIRLIAGLIARRILVWKGLHDEVKQGERIGMIKFGSRVEVYFPQEVELCVKEGNRVKAGETIIGKIKVLPS
jgi:phosphatidylserine decarboxylase